MSHRLHNETPSNNLAGVRQETLFQGMIMAKKQPKAPPVQTDDTDNQTDGSSSEDTGDDDQSSSDDSPNSDLGNRFVDTEEDLPCWGIPVPQSSSSGEDDDEDDSDAEAKALSTLLDFDDDDD